MDFSRIPSFDYLLLSLLEQARSQYAISPVMLGGLPGTNGGGGAPPGGFVGQLAQRYVTFDTSELESTSGSSLYSSGSILMTSGSTLVNNLNRIRYWMRPARWFEPAQTIPISNQLYVRPGIWYYSTGSPLVFGGGNTPTISSGSVDRVDVVYLDTSGNLQVSSSGTTNPTYPVGTYLHIAEVLVKIGGTVIQTEYNVSASSIRKDVRPFFGGIGGGGVSGGAADRIVIWSAADALTYDDAFRYDRARNVVTLTSGSMGLGVTDPQMPFEVVTGMASLSVFHGFSDYGQRNLVLEAYSITSGGNSVILRSSRSVKTSGSPLLLGNELGGFMMSGFGATAWHAVKAGFKAYAVENWSDSVAGSKVGVLMTPAGTASIQVAFYADQVLGNDQLVGTGAEKNLTSLRVNDSVRISSGSVVLQNDQRTPLADHFYGTDIAGVRGWQFAFKRGDTEYISSGSTGPMFTLLDGEIWMIGVVSFDLDTNWHVAGVVTGPPNTGYTPISFGSLALTFSGDDLRLQNNGGDWSRFSWRATRIV